MGRLTKFTIIFLTLVFFSCKNEEKQKVDYYEEKKIKKEQQFDCNKLSERKVIYEIANSIIENHNNENIWNLTEIDTTEYFTKEDYFINSRTKNRIVILGGNAGLSSGTANNLLLLLDCTNSLKIVWSGQIGEINPSDIKDINEDGIKEIVCTSSTIWMGECNDNYNIFNFKGGKQNMIFNANSNSVLDCGKDNLADQFKIGDTLENKFDCAIIKLNNKEFNIQKIQTSKIHSGGLTDTEIMKNLKIFTDTTFIKLK
jgi:hypothetical protein